MSLRDDRMTGSLTLPMFPLQAVLFPGGRLPLQVFEPRYVAMTRHCLATDRRFGVVLIARGPEVGGGDERTATGTIAVIDRAVALPAGRIGLLAHGTERIHVERWLPDDPYPRAVVRLADCWPQTSSPAPPSSMTTSGDSSAEAGDASSARPAEPAPLARPTPTSMSMGVPRAIPPADLVERAEVAVRRALNLRSELGDGAAWPAGLAVPHDHVAAMWLLCELAPLGLLDRQRLLELDDPADRLRLLVLLADASADSAARQLSLG